MKDSQRKAMFSKHQQNLTAKQNELHEFTKKSWIGKSDDEVLKGKKYLNRLAKEVTEAHYQVRADDLLGKKVQLPFEKYDGSYKMPTGVVESNDLEKGDGFPKIKVKLDNGSTISVDPVSLRKL